MTDTIGEIVPPEGDPPSEPDENTRAGLENDDFEQKKIKARTPGVRADDLEHQLIGSLQETVVRERDRCDRLESRNHDLRSAEVELANIKAPHILRKSIMGLAATFGGFGTLIVTAYPATGSAGLLSLSASATHGTGVALLFMSALGTAVLAFRA